MFPLLGIIVAFLLGLSYPGVVREPHAPDIVGTVAVLVFYAGASRVAIRLAVRRARRSETPFVPALLATEQGLRLAALAAYAAVVYLLHWPRVTAAAGVDRMVLVPELLVLLPFLVLLVLHLLASHEGERALDLHDFTRGQHLSFHLRQYLLPTLPVLFFLLLSDLFRVGYDAGIEWVADLRILYTSYGFLQWATLAALLFALYCVVPFLLRFFWRAKPLPPGPLRTRLEEFSRREGFRAREILVWPTGGNVLNAAVIGIAAPFRYVLVTDALLEALPEDEIEAVFAHEVGHAKHGHMLLFFLFTIGYALLSYLLVDLLESSGADGWFAAPERVLLLGIGGFLLWFGIVFGFVSRRFEQQADVYGALATGRVAGDGAGPALPGEHPFVRALEGLAREMGEIREAKGWRHFPLTDRIDFLVRFLSSEDVRRKYRRGMAALLIVFFGLLLALGTAAATTIPRQIREGRLESTREKARWLVMHGRADEIAGLLGGSAALRQDTMRYLDAARSATHPVQRIALMVELAQGYLALGEIRAARAVLSEVIQAAPEWPGALLLYGRILKAEGRPGGARLAAEDARRLPR